MITIIALAIPAIVTLFPCHCFYDLLLTDVRLQPLLAGFWSRLVFGVVQAEIQAMRGFVAEVFRPTSGLRFRRE